MELLSSRDGGFAPTRSRGESSSIDERESNSSHKRLHRNLLFVFKPRAFMLISERHVRLPCFEKRALLKLESFEKRKLFKESF